MSIVERLQEIRQEQERQKRLEAEYEIQCRRKEKEEAKRIRAEEDKTWQLVRERSAPIISVLRQIRDFANRNKIYPERPYCRDNKRELVKGGAELYIHDVHGRFFPQARSISVGWKQRGTEQVGSGWDSACFSGVETIGVEVLIDKEGIEINSVRFSGSSEELEERVVDAFEKPTLLGFKRNK